MSIDYFTKVQASSGWSKILGSFVRFADPQSGWRTLDAGCGPGALVRHLARMGCRAAGVDADAGMVERARELAAELAANPEAGFPADSAEFHHGDVLALPFKDGAFDLVTASNVLFLLPDPLAGVRELARVCRDGGRLAMLNPSPRLSRASAEAHAQAAGLGEFEAFSLAKWGGVAEAHQRFSPDQVQAMFDSAGVSTEAIVEKVGPGFAVYAKGIRRQAPVQS